jgi:voltage-gated potassium channel
MMTVEAIPEAVVATDGQSVSAQEQRPSSWDLMIMALSLFVVVALAVETFVHLDAEVSRILRLVDTAVCFLFLADFVGRISRAESKLAYMKWGWIDLISSIPAIDALRWGRVFRIVRVLRLLRGVRSLQMFSELVFHRRVEGTLATASVGTVLLLLFSAIAILNLEAVPEANIRTAEDALWWALTTMTTVGYGDKYPVTNEGRLVGVMLMTGGVGLFGIFTGMVASWFVGERK